jgi:YaiO family outer membrane protein
MRLAGAAFLPLATVLASPASAQTAEQDHQAGIAARRSGDPAEALRRLERALESEPDNSDIHLQIGLAQLALGRLDEAEAAFRRTLELAPDYEDARLGLARVALRRGDGAAAKAELDRVARGGAEVRLLRRQIASSAWRWRLDMEASYTGVDRQSDWQSAAINLQHRISPGTILALASETTRRFDETDTYTEARVDRRFAPGGNVYALAGATPDADHRPGWQAGLGASIRVHGGGLATAVQLDLRQAHYRSGDIQTLNPGFEQYFGGRFSITGRWINVWDRQRHSAGWLARADYSPSDRLRLFAGIADAPDLSEGTVIETSSLFGGVAYDVSDRLSLRLALARDDPEGPSDRSTLSIGLGHRF